MSGTELAWFCPSPQKELTASRLGQLSFLKSLSPGYPNSSSWCTRVGWGPHLPSWLSEHPPASTPPLLFGSAGLTAPTTLISMFAPGEGGLSIFQAPERTQRLKKGMLCGQVLSQSLPASPGLLGSDSCPADPHPRQEATGTAPRQASPRFCPAPSWAQLIWHSG